MARTEATRWMDYASDADLDRLLDCATAGFAEFPDPADPAVEILAPGSTGCPIELRLLGEHTLELRYEISSP